MDIVDTLGKLVAFRSVTGEQGENQALLEWVLDVVNGLPVYHHAYNHNGYPSLVLTTQDTKKPKVMLMSHVDVVPADRSMFTARGDGDRLIGRGVYDMKFAVACYLKLLHELGDTLPEYDFGIMLVSDEETGGFNCAQSLLGEEGYRTDICFLPDGGENWMIETHAKGVWRVKLTCEGDQAHASRPWEGDNPIMHLVHALSGFCNDIEMCKDGDTEHAHRTISVTRFGGGVADNVIPGVAEATFDIRFMDMEELKAIRESFDKMMQRHPTIAYKELDLTPEFDLSLGHPLVQEYINVMPEEYKDKQSGFLSHGSSDARWFLGKDIPVVLTRPLGGDAHTDEEWIDIKDLGRFYDTMKRYVDKAGKLA